MYLLFGIVQTMISATPAKRLAKTLLKKLQRWISNTFSSFTPTDLNQALVGLGVSAGDTVLVHSSFDAFTGFQGKPTDVIAVLQSTVGSNGLLMMPTMTFSGTAVQYARSLVVFDVMRTPSRMGLLSELFRRSQGVVRSIHPTHPVAIWGAEASAVAANHHLASTPCGTGTPFEALLKRQGKIVLLGTDINVLTFYHLLEEAMEHELPVDPFTAEIFNLQSKARDGQVLHTHCRLFEPAISKRRNLYKIVPHLKAAGMWRSARVGGVNITVLAAADVEAIVRAMSKRKIYCYE